MTTAPRRNPARRQEHEARQRFDLLADRFKNDVDPDDFRLEAIRRHLRLGSTPQRLLDVGCGKGRFASRLATEGHEVFGLDPSRRMLAASAPGKATLVQAAANRIPFADSTFDHALVIEVLEHVHPHAWLPTLRELFRVLRPSGHLLLIDKNAASMDPIRPWLPAILVKWIDRQRGLWMYPAQSPGRERWFWPGQVARLMRKSGFVSIQTEMLPTKHESRSPLFHALPWTARMVVWTGQVPDGAKT